MRSARARNPQARKPELYTFRHRPNRFRQNFSCKLGREGGIISKASGHRSHHTVSSLVSDTIVVDYSTAVLNCSDLSRRSAPHRAHNHTQECQARSMHRASTGPEQRAVQRAAGRRWRREQRRRNRQCGGSGAVVHEKPLTLPLAAEMPRRVVPAGDSNDESTATAVG